MYSSVNLEKGRTSDFSVESKQVLGEYYFSLRPEPYFENVISLNFYKCIT